MTNPSPQERQEWLRQAKIAGSCSVNKLERLLDALEACEKERDMGLSREAQWSETNWEHVQQRNQAQALLREVVQWVKDHAIHTECGQSLPIHLHHRVDKALDKLTSRQHFSASNHFGLRAIP